MGTTYNKIYVDRSFACSAHELFNWITQPQLLAKWFGPEHLTVANVKAKVRLGGNYRIELLKPNGERFLIAGDYLKMERPYKLHFSFTYKGIKDAPPKSVVKITIEEIDPRTSKLSLVQEFETSPPDIENRTRAWEYMFERLYGEVADTNAHKNM